jgi:hypothetical protein
MLSTAALAPTAAAQPCFDPAAFGAVSNDNLDDRLAFQAAVDAAIAAQGEVCVGPGNWDLETDRTAGVNFIGSIRVAGANGLVIRGTGPATRLRMLGSGDNADWRLIDIREGSANVRIADLWLDGSRRSQTEEQTHLLHLNGPVTGVTVERVWFDLPRIAGEGGGDCIRLLGGAGAEVNNVILRQLTGVRCDRSFVGVQRGVRRVLLQDSTSVEVGDQSIDFEPTGGLGVSDIWIIGNKLARGPDAQGAYTVAIGGDGAAVAQRVLLASTLVADGGVHVIDTQDVTLSDVVVTGRPGFLSLHIRKRAQRINIVRSTFIRPAGAPDGPAVSIHHQSDQAPTSVTIDNSVIVQNAESTTVNIESLQAFTLTDSLLSYRGPATATTAVNARAIIAPIASMNVRGNVFEGPTNYAVRLVGTADQPIGTVAVTGNTADALALAGVRFESMPSVTPVICDNDFGAVPPVSPVIPIICP